MSASSNAAPSFHWEETEDRTDMCAPGLRVAFMRSGALWTHALLLPLDNGLEIARAVDSDPDRDQPSRIVSPVYQEIRRHESADGRALCLLLTGTLFKHHFSAVVSLAPDPDQPDGVILDVDVADRCRTPIENLAATYTVKVDGGSLADANPSAITWDKIARNECGLELIAVAPSTLALAEAGRTATRVQVLAEIRPGSFTHRLHYRWRWTSNSGLTR